MQGASPLASPGAGRGAALDRRALAAPRGGRAFLVAGSHCRHGTLWGACRLCRLPILPLAYLSAPIPPTPPSPPGKGETISLFCRGRSPRHPGIRPLTALTATATMVPDGGLPFWSLVRPATTVPSGGLPSLSPAYPAFSLLACPHPPYPLPSGKGETISLFCRGLRPRHPGIRPFTALTDTATMVPGGGVPFGSLVRLAAMVPGGVLAVFVACRRCL